MQHAVGLVNAQTEAFEKRHIADQDAESDGQQQQRLVFFGNRQIYEQRADQKHNHVSKIR